MICILNRLIALHYMNKACTELKRTVYSFKYVFLFCRKLLIIGLSIAKE